jgi:TRAP-type C4-dicarboxylate transport system permease small subunit
MINRLIDRILHLLNTAALWIGGVAILAMTLLGGFDILSTLVLGQPIHTTHEATQTLMVLAVFMGLGMVHQNRSHISVDLGYHILPRIGKRLADLLILMLIAGFFGLLAWRGWQAAIRSWNIGEFTSGLVRFPVWPARFALATGASLAVLCCVLDLLRLRRYHGD